MRGLCPDQQQADCRENGGSWVSRRELLAPAASGALAHLRLLLRPPRPRKAIPAAPSS